MARFVLFTALVSWPSLAGVMVPADLGVGPQALWFTGPLLENRGGIPHFALTFNLYAVIDREWIESHQDAIPERYKRQAGGITELRVGPSIFIPSTVVISPKADALGGAGMFGLTWTPLGLTLLRTGPTSSSEWRQRPGSFSLDGELLITALYIYSDFAGIPPTVFFRPGLQLKATALIHLSEKVLISLGGGAQAWVPQRLGDWLQFGPIDQAVWFAAFAFLKFHVRFPYEVTL